MAQKAKAVPKPAKKTTAKTDKPIDLNQQATALREETHTLKRNMLTGDVQNVRAYKFKRRELARVLTKINQVKLKGDK